MKVKNIAFCAGMALALALGSGCAVGADPGESTYDVVIYGSSPAALTSAIEAQRHGRTAVIVCPETRIGGLTTGGLGQTDIGNKSAFGGLALQFYKDVADWYKDPAHWKYEKRSDYVPDGQCAGSLGEDSMWTFEPSAALAILERWERENRLKIVRGEFLDRRGGGVEKNGGRIVAIRTLSGKVFRRPRGKLRLRRDDKRRREGAFQEPPVQQGRFALRQAGRSGLGASAICRAGHGRAGRHG